MQKYKYNLENRALGEDLLLQAVFFLLVVDINNNSHSCWNGCICFFKSLALSD